MSLRSLLQNLSPPAVSRTLRLSLRARRLLMQTTAFAHLLGGLGPRAFSPVVELESSSPLINGVARCRDSSSISEVPYHCHMQGKQYKTPHHKKYLTKIPTYWKMVSYLLIKEGQLSHKYAIMSSVELMNLLSKGSKESLPKYRSTIWKNVLVPSCSILLLMVLILETEAQEFFNMLEQGPVDPCIPKRPIRFKLSVRTENPL